MRVFEDPTGLILVAPTPLLRSLLHRIISRRNASSRTPTEPSANGEGPEMPEIILQPLTTETVEGLTNLLNRASLSPLLVLGDIDAFQALATLDGPDVEGYEELQNSVFHVAKEETLGQAEELETSADTSLVQLLSPRELEVLEQLTLGYSNNQIAKVLSITPNTVFTHVRHIKTKLKTSNRTQTALVARTMLHQS